MLVKLLKGVVVNGEPCDCGATVEVSSKDGKLLMLSRAAIEVKPTKAIPELSHLPPIKKRRFKREV